MSADFLTEIRKIAEDLSAREGCYLYDIEFAGAGGGRVLRVTIDKEGESGVSIEDCSKVSRGLNEFLDDEKVPGGQYLLEVSSPGLERVLKEPRHFEKALGKKISVKTFAPLLQFNEHLPQLGKAKQVQGRLLTFDASGLRVAWDELLERAQESKRVALLKEKGASEEAEVAQPDLSEAVFVPFESVTKAHVVFEFTEPSEKKGPHKGPKKHGAKGKSKK